MAILSLHYKYNVIQTCASQTHSCPNYMGWLRWGPFWPVYDQWQCWTAWTLSPDEGTPILGHDRGSAVFEIFDLIGPWSDWSPLSAEKDWFVSITHLVSGILGTKLGLFFHQNYTFLENLSFKYSDHFFFFEDVVKVVILKLLVF